MKFQDKVVRYLCGIQRFTLFIGFLVEVLTVITLLSPPPFVEIYEINFVVAATLPLLICLGIILYAESFFKRAKQEFSEMFFQLPNTYGWKTTFEIGAGYGRIFVIRTRCEFWEFKHYQKKVDAKLKELAKEFLDKSPDVAKLMALREKFWRAHNLAWSLGFSVSPEMQDYRPKK